MAGYWPCCSRRRSLLEVHRRSQAPVDPLPDLRALVVIPRPGASPRRGMAGRHRDSAVAGAVAPICLNRRVLRMPRHRVMARCRTPPTCRTRRTFPSPPRRGCSARSVRSPGAVVTGLLRLPGIFCASCRVEPCRMDRPRRQVGPVRAGVRCRWVVAGWNASGPCRQGRRSGPR